MADLAALAQHVEGVVGALGLPFGAFAEACHFAPAALRQHAPQAVLGGIDHDPAAGGDGAHQMMEPAEAAAALGSFHNVRRRMELRGTVERAGGAITVYDDFAHHPTAIRTTLDGLRRQLDGQGRQGERILAVFEPRSNTMKLGTMAAQLPWSLEAADLSFCHSGGLGWDAAAALAPMGERARVVDAIEPLVTQVASAAQPGDHIVCMSNGGFGGVHDKLLSALRLGATSA